jgi:hypothetical protein
MSGGRETRLPRMTALREPPVNPYTPLMTHIRRIDVEIQLNNGRTWLLETYTALGDAAMSAPATRDEHDPELWWTPKDHFAHASRLVSISNRLIRSHLFGEQPPVVLDHGAALEATPVGQSIEAMLAGIHLMTHEVWEENRDRSVSEIVAMGQRARADQLHLLGELTDEQLDGPGPLGAMSIAELILLGLGHDRLHLRWALDGLAERAAG